jgi:hypothetical protein
MFRFSIRDVLWLTVVVAVGCAWWNAERKKTAEMATLAKCRQHALILRGNLLHAQWRYVPGKAPWGITGVVQPVDWSLIEEPIP